MVEIVVNNESLDLLKNEVISLTISVNDIGDISQTKGDYTNTFKVPATSRNLGIIGYVNDVNTNDSNTTEYLQAKLKENGATFREGFVSIDEYDEDREEISITFYGGNVSWFDVMKEKDLRDTDISEYDHTYNITDITNSFTATEGYIYPLVNNGRITTSSNYFTDIYDWTPAVYVHTVVNNMFRDIGYKLSGSFINSDIYKRLILPYSYKELRFFNYNDISVRLFDAENDTTLQTWSGFSPGDEVKLDMPIVVSGNEAGFYNTSTSTYTIDFGGTVNIIGEIEVDTDISNYTDYDFVVKKGGVDLFVVPLYTGVGRPVPYFILDQENISVSNTNTLELYLRYDAGAPVTAATVTINRARLSVTKIKNTVEGSRVYVSGTLPDMKQADLMSSLFNMFGLVVQEDRAKREIEINFFSDIKKNISIADDWSDKLDLSVKPKLEYQKALSGYGKKNYFRYKENSSDAANVNYLEANNISKGDGYFVLENDIVSPEKEVFTSQFSATMMVKSFIDVAVTGSGGQIPWIQRYSDSSQPLGDPDVDPSPRILLVLPDVYVSQFLPAFGIGIRYNNLASSTVESKVPFAYFDKRLYGSTVDDFRRTLIFSRNVPSEETSDSLLDTFYSDYVEILRNPKALYCRMDLNPIDIENLDFMIPKYISKYNAYFFLNKIEEYRGGAETTRCEFIKIG